MIANTLFAGFAGFGFVSGLRAAFASEGGGGSEDQRRGNDGNSDGTE